MREDLVTLEGELRSLLEASEEAARPVDLDEPIGRVSRIDAIAQQSMNRANREAARLRLQQVEAALRRIEAEEFGECLACGEDVGFGRLKARPEAPLCIGCQNRREGGAAR